MNLLTHGLDDCDHSLTQDCHRRGGAERRQALRQGSELM